MKHIEIIVFSPTEFSDIIRGVARWELNSGIPTEEIVIHGVQYDFIRNAVMIRCEHPDFNLLPDAREPKQNFVNMFYE
jgi:hypothetical protein